MSASINRKATKKKEREKGKSQRSRVAGQKAGGDKEEAERRGGGGKRRGVGARQAGRKLGGKQDTHSGGNTHLSESPIS